MVQTEKVMEKERDWTTRGGHSALQSASIVKVGRRCIPRGEPDDTTTIAKAPPPPPPSALQLAGGNLSPHIRLPHPRISSSIASSSSASQPKQQIRGRTATRTPPSRHTSTTHHHTGEHLARYGEPKPATRRDARSAEPADAEDDDQDDATDETGRARAKPKAKTKVWSKVQGIVAAMLPKAYHSKSTSKSEHPHEAETDFDDDTFDEDYQESRSRDTFVDHFNNKGDHD
jgi:hypothetical protein